MSRRAGRRGYTSDTTTNASQEDDIIIEDEEEDLVEEEEEDENEVTRCICGNDELTNDLINKELASFLKKQYKIDIDQGLFILCENCSVWQHGYCVGLFENNDVPDKYWCELCKPELHILVRYDGYSNRTLYKPVNDKRKKLELMAFNETIDGGGQSKKKIKNERSSPQVQGTHKDKRKERRHHHHHTRNSDEDDEYDEQLKRALRESAKESGIKVSESETNDNTRANEIKIESDQDKKSQKDSGDENSDSLKKRKSNESLDKQDIKRPKSEKSGQKSATDYESNTNINQEVQDEQEQEQGEEDSEEKGNSSSSRSGKRKKRTPPRASSVRPGNKKSRESSIENNNNNNNNNTGPTITKEELIQQPSKPRYVNDNSTIYELRKRTMAILEWLGRSQLEIEEEKQQKLQLFSFIGDDEEGDNGNNNEKQRESAQKDTLELRATFDENLLQMEKLTERILAWQDKFNKYAV